MQYAWLLYYQLNSFVIKNVVTSKPFYEANVTI